MMKKIPVAYKLNFAVFGPLVFLFGALLYYFLFSQKSLVEDSARREAQNAVDRLEAIRDYLSKTVEGDSSLYFKEKFLDLIPAVVIKRVAKEHLASSGVQVRQISQNPRNLFNKPDSLDNTLFQKASQTDAPMVSSRIGGKTPAYRFLYPLRAEISCLMCHTTPEVSPPIINKTYGMERGFGYKLHDVLGAYSIQVPVDLQASSINQNFLKAVYFILISLIVGLIAISILVNRSVLRPIKKIHTSIKGYLPSKKGGTGKLKDNPNELTVIQHSVDEMLLEIQRAHFSELREREKKYQKMINSMDDIIFVFTLNGVLNYANLAGQTFLGENQEGLSGKPLDNFPQLKSLRLPQYLTNKRFPPEIFEPQSKKHFLCNLRLEAKMVGKESAIILVLKDITDLKSMHAKLLNSERMAVVGKMSSQVAHEIRNPLGAIGLNLELLGDELPEVKKGDDKEAQNLITAIRREIKRLTDITHEYLEFGRLSVSEKKKVPLDKAVREVVDLLGEEAKTKKVTLGQDFQGDGFFVFGDPDKVKQVIINLSKNGIDACTNGSGEVKLQLTNAQGRIQLEVTDTGQGIEAADLKRIFDPFFTRKAGGTGLGLPITKQIVEDMNGKIEVFSQKDHGTTFTISF